MALVYGNRIKVNATGGTGNLTLSTPVDSFVSFPDGQTIYTILADDFTWETGIGTVTGTTLVRDIVYDNYLGTTATIDFTSKTIQVAQTIPGSKLTELDYLSRNDTDFTMDIDTGIGPVLQIGQEQHIIVHNATGAQLDNGTPVYPVGQVGGRPSVDKAIADTHVTLTRPIFVLTMDIPDGQNGIATSFGFVRGIDTSSFAVGQELYLSATAAGEYTSTKPKFPDYPVRIGGVTTQDAVNGEIFVSVAGEPEDTFVNFWNGTFREPFNFLVSSDGTVITGTLSPADGNPDLTMLFSDGFSMFDTSPSATITLTAGTDTSPQTNFIYITQATKVLAVSTSGWPSGEHLRVSVVVLQSAATVQTNGALKNQNWNDYVQSADTDQGYLSEITRRLRSLGAAWESGAATSLSVSGSPSDLYLSNTSGKVFQLHIQDFPALDMSTGDKANIVNDSVTPYLSTTNLNVISLDANGDSLNTKWFNIVVWGIVNKAGDESHLMVNLPAGSYNTEQDALANIGGKDIYSIPQQFKGVGFLLARFTLRLSGTTFTYNSSTGYLDLRGFLPNSTAGAGAGGSGVTEFTQLTDTPSTYTSQTTKVLAVNVSEDALEFVNRLDVPGTIADNQLIRANGANGNLTQAAPGVYVDDNGNLLSNDKTLAAIDKQINANTTVAACIYIPSIMDHDKGEALFNARHTSWYNETLNTATRGATRDFPRVALIVAEASQYTIYNGTDSVLPMWRVRDLTGKTITSIVALGGKIYVGTTTGVFVDDYVNDNIDSASETYTTSTTPAISNNSINSLAITQDASGSNIIYVGSDGGLDRIDTKDNSVSSWSDDGNASSIVSSITIEGNYVVFAAQSTDFPRRNIHYPIQDALVEFRYFDTSYMHYDGDKSRVSWTSQVNPIHYGNTSTFTNMLTYRAFATNRGLTQIIPNPSSWGEGLLNTTTDTSISGWQFGDIRGAWMGSNVAEALRGTELVTNGTFDTDTTGWSAADATLSVDTNRLKVTNTAAYGDGYQQIAGLVVGKTYVIGATLEDGDTQSRLILSTSVDSGNVKVFDDGYAAATDVSYTFVATQTSYFVRISPDSVTIGAYCFGDNISVVQADPDLSYNNNGLTTVGSIAKAAVAIGSELMGYKGGSTFNHMKVPSLNSDFGTGDFNFRCWLKLDALLLSYDTFVDMYDDSGVLTDSAFYARVLFDETISFYTKSESYLAGTQVLNVDQWYHVLIGRENGDRVIYIDNILDASDTNAVNVDTTGGLMLLSQNSDSGRWFNGQMALSRLGAGFPSVAQRTQIYESEKHLFTEGAQFSTSQLDITAIDYNETTQELIEQTASGWTKRGKDQLVVHESGNDAGTVIAYEDGYLIRGS